MGLVIAPRGFLDQCSGAVIADINAFGNETTLLLIEFTDGTEMLFPGPEETGGAWKYPKGLEPGQMVSANWTKNEDYDEDNEDSGPKAYFNLSYDD